MYYPSRSRVSSEGRGTVEKVGFVGLGIMGAAMVRNLLGAGHKLVVHNRTRAKAELFAGHGAEVADSPREVAEKSDVVVTMLPGPPEVEGRADERTRTADLLITSLNRPVSARISASGNYADLQVFLLIVDDDLSGAY
jgi:lactate dehydrogenase-like 2-hydroxyacid dehydrogenase